MEALDYDDTDPVVLDNLGQIYYRMGDMDKVLSILKSIGEGGSGRYPVLPWRYIRRGGRRRKQGNFSKSSDCNISALSTIKREDIEEKMRELTS